MWLAFRDTFREFSRRGLTVRQTRPLGGALGIRSLACFVFALAVPGGNVIGSLEWLPLLLLVGAAVVIGVARVSGLALCGTTRPSSGAPPRRDGRPGEAR